MSTPSAVHNLSGNLFLKEYRQLRMQGQRNDRKGIRTNVSEAEKLEMISLKKMEAQERVLLFEMLGVIT